MHCAICLEDVPSSLIFKTTERCSHSFCRHCIFRYIIASTDSRVANVRCPGLACDATLDPVYCRQLVPGKQFLRWCDLLCTSAVLGFARCYCPNLNCGELIISEKGGGNGDVGTFKCPRCSQSGCFQCSRPWVEGHRCVHGDANTHLLERLARRNRWQPCPNCNIFVERLGGCSLISCRCGTRFCHECGRVSCVCREYHPAHRRLTVRDVCWIIVMSMVSFFGAIVLLVLFVIIDEHLADLVQS